MTQTGAAVIIVNWNSGDTLKRCLAAMAAQTFAAKRVIVVDNLSSDGSVNGAESVLPGVEVVRLDKNLGFAAANNLAVKMASDCEWVALLNPDAYPAPDWLEKLLGAAKSNPDFTFFASRSINAVDTSLMDGAGDAYHTSGRVWRRGFLNKAAEFTPPSGEVFSPCAAAALYRRDLFLETGGLDESYFCYVEDVDLGFRLRLKGHRCFYVSDAVVYHVGSGATQRHSDFTVYHGHRNLVWTFVKNMPGPLFWIYLPQHLMLNIVSVIYLAARGQGKIALKAKVDAIMGLGSALRARSGIQKTKTADWRQILCVMERGLLKALIPG